MLVARWRDNVTPESADIYTTLEAWRRQNRHLYQWECRERTKALRRRKDIYRNWVAGLRKRYAHVVIEKCDYCELARDAAPDTWTGVIMPCQGDEEYEGGGPAGNATQRLGAAMGVKTIAALFVQKDGCYYGLDGVDPWPEERDARLYNGPHPVVAHPPCARWCRLAGLVEARWGHKRGDDGGCFASALASVRQWGGVLEHPAYSDAWLAHDLLPPITGGGWTSAGLCGGWTCYVEQQRYGHAAKKATWLYAHGQRSLPSLRWGCVPDQDVKSGVSWCGNARKASAVVGGAKNRSNPHDDRPRLFGKHASATPPAFRDVLIALARAA